MEKMMVKKQTEALKATDDALKLLDSLLNKKLTKDVMEDMDRCIRVLNDASFGKAK